MGQFGVGQGITRVEDQRLLTGHGSYTDDLQRPDALQMAVVRSPYAHAEIESMDTTAARQADGVHAVYTVAELDAAGIGDIPCMTPIQGRDGNPPVMPGHPVLARGRVRHVGDPVAVVVAETAQQAADAAELVELGYRELDHVIGLEQTLADGAPQIWEQAPNNLCLDFGIGDEAAADAGLAGAHHVTRLKLVNNRVVVASLEPRAALGEYDAETGTYGLTTGSQGVHGLRNQLAQHILKVDPERVRVTTPDVGGGFGMKIFLYGEQVAALHAAKELGRPVRWSGQRTESFLSDVHGRDHVSEVQIGFDADARIVGVRIDTIANLGAYLSNFGPYVATSAGARMYPGVYDIPALFGRTRAVFTNTVPVDAYRGAGRPEAAYLLERTMDVAARELGLCPAELRERNFIRPNALPHTTATGMTYDSGDFARIQKIALERADAQNLAQRKADARRRGKLRGLGHASYIECCAGIGEEEAKLRLDGDGGVTLWVGTQTNGQGHATAYAQLIADRLGLTPEQIRVRQGDTAELEFGRGTGGSRSLLMGGGATNAATDKAIEKARQLAAWLMECAPGDVEFEAGTFTIAGTDRQVRLQAVAEAAQRADLPDELAGGVEERARYQAPPLTYPNGCHVCEVEIDAQTFEVEIVAYTIVDDAGTIVNPLMLRGQVHGGTAQGIGQALLENTAYDPDSGQLITASFQDYTMPRADDLPTFDVSFVEDIPCTTNPMGIKGAGEAGAIGAPPAVINALVDALAPYGVTHIDMPATPQRLFETVQAARPAEAAE
jgi:carbon-monoxide dehydrogenase large subunit